MPARVDPLELDDVIQFATDWGRWLLEQEDCYPERAKCVSLESNYTSPQRWNDDQPIFYTDPNVHRARAFESVYSAQQGPLSMHERSVLRTHYVRYSWWRLTEAMVPPGQWMALRVRNSGVRGMADYMQTLEDAHNVLARALTPFAHLR